MEEQFKIKYNYVIKQIKSYSLHDRYGNVICFSFDAILNYI
jgi:hypothetical protein